MKRKILELNTSNKKLFNLDFDHSRQSIYSQSSINLISKGPNQNKIDLRMFCEKLHL